jgi:hypothetical protein
MSCEVDSQILHWSAWGDRGVTRQIGGRVPPNVTCETNPSSIIPHIHSHQDTFTIKEARYFNVQNPSLIGCQQHLSLPRSGYAFYRIYRKRTISSTCGPHTVKSVRLLSKQWRLFSARSIYGRRSLDSNWVSTNIGWEHSTA